jgi:1-acyl-sn-glycerol-3-phosphate acyltransferase
MCYAAVRGLHDLDFVDYDKLYKYIESDRDGQPLITVCNHVSTLDDPFLQSALLPASVRWASKRMRWGICTEEICFSNPYVGAFLGGGKALPIQRGGSMHQKGIATMQLRLNDGDWVHVFPEGRPRRRGMRPCLRRTASGGMHRRSAVTVSVAAVGCCVPPAALLPGFAGRVWQEGGIPLRDELGRWCSASGRCGDPWRKVRRRTLCQLVPLWLQRVCARLLLT